MTKTYSGRSTCKKDMSDGESKYLRTPLTHYKYKLSLSRGSVPSRSAMRINAFILAMCMCLYQVRSASNKAPEKTFDDLDNIDLDIAEPVLIDQSTVVDIDINLKKNIVDIPVKNIPESNTKVLDENSNDYVPDKDDSINIKRLIDLSDSGQRQKHETQNPESYGAEEKAVSTIKQGIVDTQNIFNTGLKSVSNSFKTLFAANENLPAIQKDIQNLRQTFEGQIEKLNNTIRLHFKRQIKPCKGPEIDPDLEVLNSGLRNLENNFRSGVDTLTEGVEVLSIIREEDGAARAEGTPEQSGTSDASAPQPASPVPAVQNPSQITQPVMFFLNTFRQGILNAFDNLNHVVSYALTGHKPEPVPQATGNPIVNFIQGITGSNNAQNPSNQANASQVTSAGAQASQPGPIQQLVQNNPIIKGIQSAVQRIQNPSSDTPRNEEVKENIKDNVYLKDGSYINNYNNIKYFNQGDIKSSGRVGILPETVEVLEKDVQAKSDKEIAEKIVAEEIKTPSISDKTE